MILHTCTRGSVIVVVVVVVDTKMTKSRDLGILASYKHNECVEYGEKLASESSGTVYKHHK